VLRHPGPVCILISGRGGRPIHERKPLNRFRLQKPGRGDSQRHEGDIQSLVFDSCLLYSVEFNCEFEPQLTVTQPTATGLFPRVIIIKVLLEFACQANASRD
jgi:hypothetical protein